MNDCRCSKEKEISKVETEISTIFKQLDRHTRQIEDTKKVYDLIYGMTTSISVLTEQMARNTEELTKVRKDVDTVKSIPSDYNYFKRQSEKIEHYKKVAIGAIIVAAISAFLAGKFF